MKDARPALRYAKAILNLAKETSAETEVNADMQLIAATISENLDLGVMLKSPVIKSSEKKKVLSSLFAGKTHVISLGMFDLLQEVAIETRKSEIILYQCEHTKFKI